jgi:hypothetical protein
MEEACFSQNTDELLNSTVLQHPIALFGLDFYWHIFHLHATSVDVHSSFFILRCAAQ